jgi:hypothetical protein
MPDFKLMRVGPAARATLVTAAMPAQPAAPRPVIAAASIRPIDVVASPGLAAARPVIAVGGQPNVGLVAARPLPHRIPAQAGPIPADNLRVLDPGLWKRIGGTMPPTTPGQTREQLGLPVAPGADLADTQIFEAATGGKRYHLPRYRLARHLVNGVDQYVIRIERSAQGDWVLRAALEKFRAPEIPATTATEELDHDLLLRLTYRLAVAGGGMTTKELPFQELGESADGLSVVGVLRFATPAERDQALAAITTNDGAAGILVTRSVQVGIPVSPAGAPPLFRAVTRGLQMVAEPNPLFLNLELNRYLYDGAAPGGGGPGLTAFQVKWQDRFFSYWQDAARPQIFYYLPDSFRVARRSAAPFYPMMAIRVAAGGAKPEDARMTLELAATPWIDPARLAAAGRELARKLPAAPAPDAPPAGASGGPAGGLGGVLGGLIGGAIGGGQGQQAGSQIGAVIGAAVGAGATGGADDDAAASGLQFEPLIVSKAALWLALPGAGGAGLVERPGAQVDVRAALFDAETLTLTEFQSVYDALFGGSLALLRGELRIDLGGGAAERVPFSARLDDTNGDLLQTAIAVGPTPDSLQLTLTNAIESPVTVPRLDAWLRRGKDRVPALLGGMALPLELAPGQSVSVVLQPSAALPGAGPPEPIVDLSAARAKPDPGLVWAALLDPSTPADYARAITVQAVASMFDPPPDKPDDRVLSILVQFESGGTVQLTPDKPQAETSVRQPLADIVLRRGGVPTYRYRCQLVRRSGRLADRDWRSDSFDILVPELPST